MKKIKKLIGMYAVTVAPLVISLMFYPQQVGNTQSLPSKLQILDVKISPYDKAADSLQAKISEKRDNRTIESQQIIADLKQANKTIAALKKELKRRPVIVRYMPAKEIPDESDDFTADDYFAGPKSPCPDSIKVIAIPVPHPKKRTLLQRIFNHKK